MATKPPAVHSENQLLRFQDCSTDVFVVAGTTASVSLVAAKADHTVYVRKISGCITTQGAGNLTFQDTATTPSVVGKVASSASTGGITVLDAVAKGVGLTAEKGLSLAADGSGVAGVFYIEAYYYQSEPMPNPVPLNP